MTDVQGKRVLVVGLARTGLAAARVLAGRGAFVTVTDSRAPWELRADIRELLAHKIGMELGQHREESFLNQDLIVVSPGVIPEMPQLQAARQKGIPVVSEVEAASWFLESPIIGITGSNGKTTTTSLLGEILESSNFPAFVGGNIGVPLISAVGDVPRDAFVVTELSSFQLEAIQTFRPRVAVMLNITPNHLDRHPTLEAYVQAKAHIFKNQTADDYAILNADDPAVMKLATSIVARKMFFSRRKELPEGVFVADGHIYYRVGNLERLLLGTRDILLRGDFNVENVLAASAAACVLGADFEAIRRAIAAFRGVEHRLEFVREIHGIQFLNDSKATSVDATAKALSAFNRGVHLILGGKGKGAPYAPIRALLEGRVRAVYLIGAAAERIAQELRGAVELIHCGDLETATREAYAHAVSGDVVLLSPACASFDQFQDYEQRGRTFKKVVSQLALETMNQGHETRDSRLATRGSGFVAEESPAAQQARKENVLATKPHSAETPVSPAPEAEPPPWSVPESAVSAEEEARNADSTELKGTPAVAANESSNRAESDTAAEPRAPSPESQVPNLEPRVTVPERIYFYEVAAEEIEHPEPDVAIDYKARDLETISMGDLPAAERPDDAALPFEVRTNLDVTRSPSTKQGARAQSEKDSTEKPDGDSKTAPSGGQNRLPGL